MNTEIPRRIRLDLNTPAELSIHNAMQEVEKIGADVKLTNAVIYLSMAKDLVSDFIDGSETPERMDEKDLIIQGLEEGSMNWKSEYDNCRAILQQLVQLKEIKDSAGKTEDYLKRQPLVWNAAKEFLKVYQHEN
jgi:hypothetical protein